MTTKGITIVTGASGGIGEALAVEAARAGSDLFLVARNQAKLSALAERLRQECGVQVSVCRADLSDPVEVERVIAQITKTKRPVEALINNAGFGGYGKFTETAWENEQAMINLNVLALTRLCKAVAPLMQARGRGHILNVASTAAFFSGPHMAVYFATKAYVLHLSEAMHEELRGSGVTVTALCPGATATGFARAAHADGTKLFNRKLPAAAAVARFGYQAMLAGRPVAIHGRGNAWSVAGSRLLPRTLLTRLVARVQG